MAYEFPITNPFTKTNIGELIVGLNTAVDVGSTKANRNAYAQRMGIPEHYQVVIYVTDASGSVNQQLDGAFPIIACMPERYNISVSAQWDTPFANMGYSNVISSALGGAVDAGAIESALGAVGIANRNQHQFAQVWQSTSPISINIDLVFNARRNTEEEIKAKHRALLKLACPSLPLGETTGVLLAPGPVLLANGNDKTGRNITVFLGKYLKLEKAIVKTVSSDIRSICDNKGIPTSMTINVEFETFYAGVTNVDIDKMFEGI